MSKDFRKVIKFKYNKNYYQMFIDDNNKMFFLKIINANTYEYITFQEMLIFYKKFGSVKIPLIKNNKGGKISFIPKILYKGILIVLTLTTLLSGCSKKNKTEYSNIATNSISQSIEIQEDDINDFCEKMSLSDDTELELYDANEYSRYIRIYDTKYLDTVLNYQSVSLSQINEVVDQNNNIPNNYKELIKEFANRNIRNHPDVDIRVFYENLKTLEIVECDKDDLVVQCLSFDASGCYKVSENKIYVLKNNIYEEGTWEFQVIYHELCHMMRNANWQTEDKEIRVRSSDQVANEIITDEALNSLYAVSLLNYEEDDIAYQLQSNYFRIMIDCLDNYTISDYMKHSTSYLAQQLDKQNNDDNYATVLFKAIEMQYNDYHDDSIEIEQSEFYQIYDYISNMYYKKHIVEGMSKEEVQAVNDELIEKVMFDVPKEYNIDTNHFYEYLNEYCEKNELSFNKAM